MSIILRLHVSKSEKLKRGQDHFWQVMREFHRDGRTFTSRDVYMLSNERHTGTISSFLRRLKTAGFIAECANEKPAAAANKSKVVKIGKSYRIVTDQIATPVVSRDGRIGLQGRGQQQMWNVMRRSSGGWTASDLAISASTDDVLVKRTTALSYCIRLQDAGMLTIVDKGEPGRECRWRLKGSANTGPKPPMILRSEIVFDQNVGAVVGEVIAEGERA